MNEKPTTGDSLTVGLCSNHTITSDAKGELPIPLPTAARKAHKFNNMNINLLSIGNACNKNCVSVFRKDDMFISKEEDVEIKLLKEPLVTGTRRDERSLWDIPLPPSEEEEMQHKQHNNYENLAAASQRVINKVNNLNKKYPKKK